MLAYHFRPDNDYVSNHPFACFRNQFRHQHVPAAGCCSGKRPEYCSRRGATLGNGTGWPRLTHGDLRCCWKSNPYWTSAYTGEDDALRAQWVMIDVGAEVDVNAIKIAWANPYAKRYYVQLWAGEQEPF